jgi:hypothetical protein
MGYGLCARVCVGFKSGLLGPYNHVYFRESPSELATE